MDSWTDSDRQELRNWNIVNLRDQKETVTSLWITVHLLQSQSLCPTVMRFLV